MKHINGKVDINILKYIRRLGYNKPIVGIPCPLGKGKGYTRKINPHLTRFYMGNGKIVDVFHIKPIYYLHQNGQWRPMSEVADGFGNTWIHLKSDWDAKMDLRYLRWLMKRMEIVKAKLGVCIPLEESIKVRSKQSLVSLKEARNIYFTTSTFYPNPDPETTTVDGQVDQSYAQGSGVSWATIIAAAGNSVNDNNYANNMIQGTADNINPNYKDCSRYILLFDTSSIPDGDTISAATISLYGQAKDNALGASPTITVVSSAPASNTALVAGDYDSLGTTEFISPRYTYASWLVDAYNDLTLNASGRSNISKTGVSKFGIREGNYDLDAVQPPWVSLSRYACNTYSADNADTTKDPKLVVEHTTPLIEKFFNITESSLISRIRTVNKIYSITESSLIVFQRIIDKLFQIAESSLITFQKWTNYFKQFLLTEVSLITFQKWGALLKQFIITEVSIINRIRIVNKVRSITENSIITFQKWVNYIKQFIITAIGIINFQKGRILFKQFVITISTVISFIKKWMQKIYYEKFVKQGNIYTDKF